jgi:hypothetical protein
LRALCLFILTASPVLTALFLVSEIPLLRIPYQLDYGEGHVLWLTLRILDRGSGAYKPLDSLPYVVCPYPPLYMLAARFAHLPGGGLLTAGRWLSLASAAGIGIALALTVLMLAPARVPLLCRVAGAAFTGVLPLLMDSVDGWAPLMRVDMLALFLMYAGLGIYLVAGDRERWQYAAGFLFVLALFTKQTMLSAPVACLSFGLMVDRRRTIRVCAGAAVLLAAGLAVANAATHGGFLIHILQYNRNPFSWKIAAVRVYEHVRATWPWMTVAAATVLAAWNPVPIRRLGWRKFLEIRSASRYGRAVMVGGLNCAFAGVLTVSVGKMGANYNHFLPWDPARCAAAPAGYRHGSAPSCCPVSCCLP